MQTIMMDQQEQVTEKYLFIITPTEIKSSSKLRSNSRKSILIKLGNQTAKCQALNTPAHLQVDVLYSRTLQKYCPLKGIIKIYDVAEDGTEIISCVGGFQTDQLLNESKTNVIIEKQIGTSKLTMEISIHNKSQGKRQQEKHSPKTQKIEIRDDRKQIRRQDRRSSLDRLPSLRSSGLFTKGLETSASRRNMSPRFKLEGPSISRPASKADISYEAVQASRNLYELEQSKKQLTILKKLAGQKDKKITSLERQIQGAQTTIRNLKETNRHLGEQNQYLRQKNDKVERSLYHKENTIDSLKKELDKLTAQFQQMDGNLYNSSLEIQELKEEVSNCNETIEKYREKYGDLKEVKNRAIQMEIKQCLRWIELQNRDLDMSEVQETTPSEHQHSEDRQNSLSSVIRGIQIEKVPKEEMTIIRGELVRILERVDEMMAK